MSLETVLIVEDDRLMRGILRETLLDSDFVILEAATGQRSIDIIKQHKVDTILLDLNLPDGYGTDFIPEIRQLSQAPLIVVSGERDEDKRLQSFEAGADDYVAKPINHKELLARVKAHLRRFHSDLDQQDQQSKSSNKQVMNFGSWAIDHEKFQIFHKNGKAGELTAIEFKLLIYLIENAGKVVKRDDLSEALREENYIPTPRAIDVKILRLRKKIGDDAANPQIVKTVRGVGYIFNEKLLAS